MSWELVKNCSVAITNLNGTILGTGFFISTAGHLLTCAHVVEAGDGTVGVMPRQGEGEFDLAQVLYLGNSHEDDFAVLQVSGYTGKAVPLCLDWQTRSHFLSIGYGRPDFPAGASIDGVITDLNPHAEFGNFPMLRLRTLADAQRVQGGYSGSPVFDAQQKCVVGIIAAYDFTEGALAVPLTTVREKWQDLEPYLQPQTSSPAPPAPTSKHVFISYRSQDPDLSLAQEFYEQLRAAGHQPFMAGASIQLGENWVERIDRELQLCDYFLLLLSPQSATSEMVTEEVRRAKELQDQRQEHRPVILPVRVNFPLESPLNYDLRGYLQRIQQRLWTSAADTAVILQEILSLLSQGGVPEPVTEEYPTIPIPESPDRPPTPVAEPELREPGGAVPPQSSWYVERTPIEADCFAEILQPGALIRIKAPRQMGKTSLMARVLNHAKDEGYHAIPLSFQRTDNNLFENLDLFLRWFCEQVGRRLGKLNQLEDYWQGSGSKDKFIAYFEECLLEEIEQPLVLGLDEVDRVFPHQEVADNFFALLRSCYDSARYGDVTSERWEKLRLVVVHSTEVYVPLDIHQSPFNVGKNVKLPEFSPQQVQDLAGRYGLTNNNFASLQELIGGHPYLVRKAFYHLRRQDLDVSELIATASTEVGIYEDHLQRHLLIIKQYKELASALREVVNKNRPVELDSQAAFKLDSMGLVQRLENGFIPRCDLYRYYFKDRI